jgi:hypothetical protein
MVYLGAPMMSRLTGMIEEVDEASPDNGLSVPAPPPTLGST